MSVGGGGGGQQQWCEMFLQRVVKLDHNIRVTFRSEFTPHPAWITRSRVRKKASAVLCSTQSLRSIQRCFTAWKDVYISARAVRTYLYKLSSIFNRPENVCVFESVLEEDLTKNCVWFPLTNDLQLLQRWSMISFWELQRHYKGLSRPQNNHLWKHIEAFH